MKALRFLRAFPLALLLIAPAHADQGSIVMPVVGPKTAAELMAAVNAGFLAVQSCNSGTTAPANGPSGAAKAMQCWADTSSNPILFKKFDGSAWVVFGSLNTSTHIWTPYRNGAPIVSVATSGSAADLTTGTLPPARLPNPSASTLGGVQSKTCSASQWLNDVSTGGVLSCAQPNFSDIAGTLALAQLPAFSGMSAASAAADADTFPTNQGSGNLKQTLAAIKTWIKAWIAKADVGLGNVDNTSDATKWAAAKALTNTTYDTAGAGNAFSINGMAANANTGTGAVARAASPTFSGVPAAPTAANGTNTTQLATTQFVQSAVTASTTGVASIAGNTGAFTLGYGLTNSGNDLRAGLSSVANSLVSDVALNNTGAFFTGPQVAQGTAGTWFCSGQVTLVDGVGSAAFNIKLWDGTTVMASLQLNTFAGGALGSFAISGIIASPAGNIRISVQDLSSTNGVMRANNTGTGKDSTLSCFRIAA